MYRETINKNFSSRRLYLKNGINYIDRIYKNKHLIRSKNKHYISKQLKLIIILIKDLLIIRSILCYIFMAAK